MKTHFFAFSLFALLSSVSLSAETDGLSIDQQIIDSIQAPEFSNSVFMYPFEGKEYPIRIIHNPKKETLLAKYMDSPITTSLVAISDLPYKLAAHIEHLVKSLGTKDDARMLLSKYNAIEIFASMHPVHIAEAIDDPINDARIREAFQSEEFVNLELHYRIDGKYSPLRLLYNPQRRLFSATRTFTIEGRKVPYTITWDHIYGIFTENYMKNALINHIYDLSNANLLEWYVNFDVQNSTEVEYVIYRGNTSYHYSLVSWFEYTEDFR